MLEIAPHPGLTWYFSFLAAAQQKAGKVDDAFESIDQALSVNPAIVVWRPEALRTRGELRLSKGHTGPAEADLRASISLAHGIGAKAWELRVKTSLARSLRGTSRREEARATLAEIYNWFTEGFDTADLEDAKTLLDELSAR